MCTKSQLNSISKAMVECYKGVYGNDIVEIVLYGSYARGDYKEDSDKKQEVPGNNLYYSVESIPRGVLECILTHNCEDTEQLRNDSYFLPSSQKATALAAATLRESTP